MLRNPNTSEILIAVTQVPPPKRMDPKAGIRPRRHLRLFPAGRQAEAS